MRGGPEPYDQGSARAASTTVGTPVAMRRQRLRGLPLTPWPAVAPSPAGPSVVFSPRRWRPCRPQSRSAVTTPIRTRVHRRGRTTPKRTRAVGVLMDAHYSAGRVALRILRRGTRGHGSPRRRISRRVVHVEHCRRSRWIHIAIGTNSSVTAGDAGRPTSHIAQPVLRKHCRRSR